MMALTLLCIYEAFSLGVAYMAFCRIHLSTSLVRWEVRWAWSMVGAGAIAMAISPFVGWGEVTRPVTFFMGASFCSLLASSRAWKFGPPKALFAGVERRRG